MKPILSIIVPIYNTESYLENCIQSILNQSFDAFELILVDDGSTDRSLEICKKYSRCDSRIKIIHQQNLGVSGARNSGLEYASGDYIGFVDGDDFIHKDMYKIMIKVIEENKSDMVVCNYINIEEDNDIEYKQVNNIIVNNFNNKEILNELFIRDSFSVAPWNKLYKKELFNNLRYRVGKVNEDEFIIHEILYRCKKISIINSELYYYVKREGSIMNSGFHVRKFDRLYALSERVDFFKKNNEYELMMKAEEWFVDYFIWNYYYAYKNFDNIKVHLSEIKLEFNKRFKGLMKNKILSLNKKITLGIFYLSPKIYINIFFRNT